jgi:hypothetical protein
LRIPRLIAIGMVISVDDMNNPQPNLIKMNIVYLFFRKVQRLEMDGF